MKRICCVCKKYLGEKPGPKDMITHGYCDSCLKTYKAKMMDDFEEIDPCFAKASQGRPIIAKTTQGKMQDKSCVAAGEAG